MSSKNNFSVILSNEFVDSSKIKISASLYMDLAIPIKNPSVPVSNLNRVNGRWIFQGDFSERKEYHQLQFNLGIGYPF